MKLVMQNTAGSGTTGQQDRSGVRLRGRTEQQPQPDRTARRRSRRRRGEGQGPAGVPACLPAPDPARFGSVAVVQMREAVEFRLGALGFSGSSAAAELSECIRDAVKPLSCGRYKLVCHVTLGPLSHCDIICSSRAVWSPHDDTFTQYIYRNQNQNLFALCLLFAVYQE